jgi:hypothetical protein
VTESKMSGRWGATPRWQGGVALPQPRRADFSADAPSAAHLPRGIAIPAATYLLRTGTGSPRLTRAE